MGQIPLAGVAAHFRRDLDFDLQRTATAVDHARSAGAARLVLPDATLGGSLADLPHPDREALPPALDPDCAELKTIRSLAAEMVVCVGYCEAEQKKKKNN